MESTHNSGHLILIVAVPGAGKTTLINHILETFPEIAFSVSCTSRPMRPGEENGREYHFISPETFQKRIENNEFLEWIQQDGGRYYGTLKSETVDRMDKGQVVIGDTEPRGVRMILEQLSPERMTSIFITAGEWEEMKARITARAPISAEELAHRQARYESELPFAAEADVVIENRDGQLEEAKQKLEAVVADIIKRTT